MPHRRSVARALSIVIASTVTLVGCALGERPVLVAPPSTISDPVTAAVLDRLDRGGTATFTATYDITPALTGETTSATVVQQDGRRRTTIGTVEYLRDGSIARTCYSGGVDCVDGLDETRISNLNITHEFWGRSASARLALDASRSVSGATGRTETIAGVGASCADVGVPAPDGVGIVVYCAIDAGLLARYNGADVRIDLTSFSPTVDETMLAG